MRGEDEGARSAPKGMWGGMGACGERVGAPVVGGKDDLCVPKDRISIFYERAPKARENFGSFFSQWAGSGGVLIPPFSLQIWLIRGV